VSDNQMLGSGGQPKIWTPMTASPAPTANRPNLLARVVLGVAGLVVIGFGFMQMGEGLGLMTGGGASSGGLVNRSFDPANPPALGDPGPAIAAHLHKVAGDAPLPDDARQAIERMVAQTRPGLPLRLDDITTLVGLSHRGRHIIFDNRVMLNERIDNLAAWRENATKMLTPSVTGNICAPGNAHIAQFLQQHNVTLWHAFTANDGNRAIFIEVPPQKCGT